MLGERRKFEDFGKFRAAKGRESGDIAICGGGKQFMCARMLTKLCFGITIICNMLTVRFESLSALAEIYSALMIEEEPCGSNFVMYDGADPVALMRVRIDPADEPVAVIDKVAFKEGVDEGDRTFFYHAMFFKLREGTPIKIRAAYVDDYLVRFGFQERAGGMEIYSQDINLYYNCGGKFNG